MQIDLVSDPVAPLLRRLAVPVGIGYFFNTMFNVVDTWYASRISTQAMAAVSLSFPLFFIIIAVGSGISTGATALIGHALGAGERDEAGLYSAQAISFALLNGVLLTVVGLVCAPTIFRIMGARGDYLSLALSYMGALFCGSVFFVTNQSQNAILNATGDTRTFRNFLVTAFLLNLVYDPWFIYGGLGLPPLGLSGIAWGTVSIQALGSLYLHARARRTGLVGGHGWRAFLPRRDVFSSLARQGFPASLSMMTVALGVFVITWYVARFGGADVAAYGIATRIEQIVLLPVMGLNVATLTLVAQNSGALRWDRVQETVRSALKGGLLLMAFGTALLFPLAHAMMTLFSADRQVIDIGEKYLRIAAFVLPAYVVLYINTFALQGLRRPRFAVFIGIFRQIVAPVPAFWLLAVRLGLGVVGVWWGIFLITWLAALISLLFIRRTMHDIMTTWDGEVTDPDGKLRQPPVTG